MEQIDIELAISNPYSRWSEDDELERNGILVRFPYSIMVATSFLEMDYVDEWLARAIGPKGSNWDFIFYYKQDYDFGYAEYFFQEEGFSIIFKNKIPKFYGVFANGEKFKTNTKGELFKVD